MPEINCEGQLVEKICRYFEVDDRFILGGVTCKFTKGEVALITGLPFYGKALDLHSKRISDIRLLQKHFSDKHLHRKDVRAKLIQLYPSNEEEDNQDFVRILIILMCATFLLPNKGYACPNNLVRYLEDLDATWEFSWVSDVHQMIIEDLRLFAERIRRRVAREGVSLGYIGGCTTALMVDPELTISQQEEHLFKPHEEALVLEKLKIGVIQRRIKEGIIEGMGKRKLVELSVESKGKKMREEEKEGEGGGEEESRGKKKREQEAKRGEEGKEDNEEEQLKEVIQKEGKEIKEEEEEGKEEEMQNGGGGEENERDQVVVDSQLEEQHVVCNIESDSVQQSSSIQLGVSGVIEERRDYDGHDLLSDDEKGWIERFLSTPITYETMLTTTKGTEVGGNHIHDILFDGSMTEGYVIDAYFDILDERILNENVENYLRRTVVDEDSLLVSK
ncbi:hypothetical protein QJS10_CPA09g00764 [Acorus calamus]|uniref:Aminotransferase-like plant mobile domain-containing protein n=1 Tax=Acorus calamus TaxID=4465 RepID=A0AAV9E761_ACOCL|nr:hypothetical protein QJS10_CPA09g00764 [Acorus calamus]